MKKRVIYIYLGVLLLLALLVVGEIIWLKYPNYVEGVIKRNKIACEYGGGEYTLNEVFLIRRSVGCSICTCVKDGKPICQETYCPEDTLNEE